MSLIERLKVYEKFKSSYVSKCCGKPIDSQILLLKAGGKYERVWTCSECRGKTTPVPKKQKNKDPF